MNELWIPRHEYATEGKLSAILHDARFLGGVAASGQSGEFGGQLFSRDTLRILADTMDKYGSFAREMFSVLPQLQGEDDDPTTNEFPGALPHQTFRQIVAGRYLPDHVVEIVEFWTDKWGVEMRHDTHNGKNFAVYNSSDSPPLYLINLAEFSELPAGRGVLNDRFVHRATGETRTVGDAALRCVSYIMRFINESEKRGSGLYVVPNTNPRQTSPSGVMRDGFDAYYHPEGDIGKSVDFRFVAYVENQALAYDALHAASKLFPDNPDSKGWLDAAERLRKKALDAFWMKDEGVFAAAIDADGSQVKLKSSAMVELINGNFLKTPDGPDYVRSLVKWAYSPEVMTAAGPRMLSLEHDRYEDEYYSYQGTGSVWPYVNGVIAKGLRQHWGLPTIAHDLGVRRTLGMIDRAGAVEMLYVHKTTGEPLYRPSRETKVGAISIAASGLGQDNQAWTASAGLREIWDNQLDLRAEKPGSWQAALARFVLKVSEDVPPASSDSQTAEYFVDVERGTILKSERAARWNLAY